MKKIFLSIIFSLCSIYCCAQSADSTHYKQYIADRNYFIKLQESVESKNQYIGLQWCIDLLNRYIEAEEKNLKQSLNERK